MALKPGSRLGSHRLVARVRAEGGEIWRARDECAGTTVLVQVLETAPERLRPAAALRHPNLRAVHELGFDSGVGFLVLETLSGETLAERLARSSLSLGAILDVGSGVAAGLEALHQAGLVHGNLDPEKVFLDRGSVKLVDFGLGRSLRSFASPVPRNPPATNLAPHFGYVAPEEARGEPADARGDVFAFGSILDDMVSGPLSIGGATVPASLRRLIGRCLSADPAERFADGSELHTAIEGVVRETLASEAARIATRSLRRRRIAAGWAIAAGIAGVAFLDGAWTAAPARASMSPATPPTLGAPPPEQVVSSDMSGNGSPLPDHAPDPEFGGVRGLGE